MHRRIDPIVPSSEPPSKSRGGSSSPTSSIITGDGVGEEGVASVSPEASRCFPFGVEEESTLPQQ